MLKTFLIEDEIVIREAIQKMVPWAEHGYELVGEAKDGEMALPLIRKTKPDVVITDIKMPFMDGLTLSRIIKKELPDTRIVIISGHDDFEYAKQAIALGVEEYLLKPVSKAELIEVLKRVQKKNEEQSRQKSYYEKFELEIKEYEKNTRRDFFDMLVDSNDLEKIYERASQLKIDITAESYNIILFTVVAKKDRGSVNAKYSQKVADIQNTLEQELLDTQNYLIFRNQIYNYAILVKSETDQIVKQTQKAIDLLRNLFQNNDKEIEWFVCYSQPVSRISQLPECYQNAMKAFGYRYLGYSQVFSLEMVQQKEELQDELMSLGNIDINAVSQEFFQEFMCNALESEVENFVRNYLQMVGWSSLKSRMFRQYIVLNIHFCVVSFLCKIGYEKAEIPETLHNISVESSAKLLEKNICDVLTKVIHMREEKSKGKYQSIINTAIQYLNENYADDSLTLNKVACVVNVSANHFSALFSQKMKQTFIEYLTGLRMEQAKKMLRCTDRRSGEIAMEVGYKDAHYFSFLFKKTQGCTPSEYRNQGGKTLVEKRKK